MCCTDLINNEPKACSLEDLTAMFPVYIDSQLSYDEETNIYDGDVEIALDSDVTVF